MIVKIFNELPEDQKASLIAQIKDIFFEASSVKKFRDEEHRSQFFRSWCGIYLEKFPEQVLLAMDKHKLLGYLCYHIDSPLEGPWAQPGVEVFKDLYKRYPAHFHINCHHQARGQGLGAHMLDQLEKSLLVQGVTGVHIITSSDQKNVSFYQKNGFSENIERDFKGNQLLFMGKTISGTRGERELDPEMS